MTKRGGKRPGAGRKPGSTNRASDDDIRTISELAQAHGPDAIATLATLMKTGATDAARVAAANAILDRGYGKPIQSTEVTGKNGGVIETQTTVKPDLSHLDADGLRALRSLLGKRSDT